MGVLLTHDGMPGRFGYHQAPIKSRSSPFEAVAAEAGTQVEVVHVFEGSSRSEGLGPQTYAGMMLPMFGNVWLASTCRRQRPR